MKRILAVVASAIMMCVALAMAGCSANQEPYTPEAKTPVVSAPALGVDGVLRVGVITAQGKAPLAGISTNNEVVGIDVDLSVWLADEMGLKLQVVDVTADPIAALEEGTVDVVLGVPMDEVDPGFWASPVYLQTGVALFAKGNAAVPEDDSNPTISAEAAKVSAWAVANEYGADALVAGNDMGEVFELLRDNAVEYAAADALIGMYAAHTVGCDAAIVALMQRAHGYVAIVPQENVDLQSALSAALQKVSTNGILTKMVETKWLGKSYSLANVPYTPLAEKNAGELAPAEDDDEEGDGEDDEEGEDE